MSITSRLMARLYKLPPASSYSEFRSAIFPGGSLNLQIFLQWLQITLSFEGTFFEAVASLFNSSKRSQAAVRHLPLFEADAILLGLSIPIAADQRVFNDPARPSVITLPVLH